MKKLALHWQIIIGMVLGIAFGLVVNSVSYKNTMGTIVYTPTEKEASPELLLQYAVFDKTEKKKDTLVASIAENPTSSGVYTAFALKGAAPQDFDLIKAEDKERYKFLSIVSKLPKTIKIKPDTAFIKKWVKPFGTIFINLLKMIAVPLIVVSLIKGVADLQDISKLSKMGGRTILFYICTTIVAVTVGLVIVNLFAPGTGISEATRESLMSEFAGDAGDKIAAAGEQANRGPLQALVDLVPQNIFLAMSNNGLMLQTIFFVIFFGIGIILIDPKKAQPVKDFFDGANEVILKLIDLIMLAAPYGVFALLAALIEDAPNAEIFTALGWYAAAVVVGLACLIAIDFLIVFLFTGRSPGFFAKGILPAQLLAFSTSSSAATLPVTMERVEEHIGVDKEVASFVLPVGATINMDGTSLYQAVAAIFIAQVLGVELTIAAQLSIVMTATLASIGSAAVPGAGMLMLVVVLESIGVPAAGIALIFAIDRPLDMCRTIVNVTGDAMVSTVVASSLGKLRDPQAKEWDDHYPREIPDPEEVDRFNPSKGEND